jgi:hypothetical protein
VPRLGEAVSEVVEQLAAARAAEVVIEDIDGRRGGVPIQQQRGRATGGAHPPVLEAAAERARGSTAQQVGELEPAAHAAAAGR